MDVLYSHPSQLPRRGIVLSILVCCNGFSPLSSLIHATGLWPETWSLCVLANSGVAEYAVLAVPFRRQGPAWSSLSGQNDDWILKMQKNMQMLAPASSGAVQRRKLAMSVLVQAPNVPCCSCSRSTGSSPFEHCLDMVLAIFCRCLQIMKLLSQSLDVGIDLLHLRLQLVLHVWHWY